MGIRRTARFALFWVLAVSLSPAVMSPSAEVKESQARVFIDPAVESQLALNGRSRVIIELRIGAGPASPEALIARAQDAVLARLPASHSVLVRRYFSVPLLALEIDADGLRALQAMHGTVASVKPDDPVTHQ